MFGELKKDLLDRLDKQDVTLARIDRRLDNTATKEDLRQIHERIDGVERRFDERILPLEQAAADERAISQHRGRFRSNLAWAAGLIGSGAIVASVLAVFVH